MRSRALWVIDNEVEPHEFERLCVDLLYRSGFKDIRPIEPQDGGRDAEESPRCGRGRGGETTFFQFSKEQSWKPKLRKTVKRLKGRGYKFHSLVYVTNQKVRGIDADALAKELRDGYGWELLIFSREWLRLQMEEEHLDLAQKYLGLEEPTGNRLLLPLSFHESPDEHLAAAMAALDCGKYAKAVAAFSEYLDVQPEDVMAWQGLAWSQYRIYQYGDALRSVNRAIQLQEGFQSRSIRGCILAEMGIRDGNKTTLIEALKEFQSLSGEEAGQAWNLRYNLGNTLSALGRHQEAATAYKEALELDPRNAAIWKNLGSVHHLLGDHEEEMRCFDAALELDPLKPEALVSKGVSLMMDYNDPAGAAALLERAIRASPDWPSRWPHVWFWVAEARRRVGDLSRSLSWVNEGLLHQPGARALLRLKAEVLGRLVDDGSTSSEEAKEFWKGRVEVEPRDYASRSRLARCLQGEGRPDEAWALLSDWVALFPEPPGGISSPVDAPLDEAVTALEYYPLYVGFRIHNALQDYWQTADPLYELPFEPPVTADLVKQLTPRLAIPFGLGVARLRDLEAEERVNALPAFFDEIRPRVVRAVVASLLALAPGGTGSQSREDWVEEMAQFLGLLAIREFSRQRGWIAGQLSISVDAMEEATDSYDEALIIMDVMAEVWAKLGDGSQ